jgi:hypothetical protein
MGSFSKSLVGSDVFLLEHALADNQTLTSLDLRSNLAIGPDADSALANIAQLVRANELSAR